MDLLIGFLLTLLVSSIPLPEALQWIYAMFSRYLTEEKQPVIRFSKTTLLIGISHALTIGKGFAVPYFLYNYPFSDPVITVSILIMVGFHIWNPARLFKQTPNALLILIGIYLFMSPPTCLLFCSIFLLTSLLFNSLTIGYLIGITSLFFAINLQGLETYWLATNLGIFMLTFISLRKSIFSIIDSNQHSLLNTFKNR